MYLDHQHIEIVFKAMELDKVIKRSVARENKK